MALALLRTLRSRNSSPATPARRMGNAPPAAASSTCTNSPTTKRTKLEGANGFIDLMCNQQLRPQAKFKDLLERLVQNSRDVTAVNEHGMTALHYSVLNKDELCTKALIVFGADINARNKYNQTPLDIALQNQVYDLVPLLVSIGCKIGEDMTQSPNTDTGVVNRRIDSGISNCSRSPSHSRSPSPPSRRSSHCHDLRSTSALGAGLRGPGDDDTFGVAATEACPFGRDGDFLAECPDCCTPRPRSSRQTYRPLPDETERRHERVRNGRVTGTRRVSAIGEGNIPLGAVASEACALGRSGDPLSEHSDCSTPRPTLNKQALYQKLSDEIERRYEMDESLRPDELLQMAMQQQELTKFRSDEQLASPPPPEVDDDCEGFGSSIEYRAEGGSRILSLDGGGIRGLLQIEILSEIERRTGKKITDLFDVIMGTSTGGIVALGLVYCKKSLSDLRQLYFRLREQIFANSRMGAYDTNALEEILKTEMGTDMKMSDVDHPKVLVAAVDKSTTQLKLRFFNNIFHDEYSTQPIWQVARYTSAAPVHFTECDNYVDGGILANNPCENGLMRIQRFYRQQEHGRRMPIACVVSVGSGISPAEALGSTSIPIGFQMIRVMDTVRRTQNFMKLLAEAIVESEAVAEKCRGICEEQNIPYYRFSPSLEEKIESGETDSLKLIAMIIKTKIYISEDQDMTKMVSLLRSRNVRSRTSPLPLR